MAGTINLSMSQQFDMDGEPLSGGLLYFFTAGTTTPQSAFQDFALTIVHPNPLVLDASGRVPSFYLADGFIKIRLTDKTGVTIIAADQLLVIGPSSGGGGGGGGSVDATTVLQTGDMKARYGIGPLDGFVRCNGLTIGKTGSGATERAIDACQALFEYIYQFPNILLDGATKSGDAHADWLAGRKLILPDLRGRTIAGMDDMGSTAASRLTSTYFGASTIVLGNVGGDEKKTLAAAELAPHTHSGTTVTESVGHTHTWGQTVNTGGESAVHTHSVSLSQETANHTHTQLGTFPSGGQTGGHEHGVPVLTVGSSGGFAGGGGLSAVTSVSYGGIGGTLTGGFTTDHAHNTPIFGETGFISNVHSHNATVGNQSASHTHSVTVGANTGTESALHTHQFTTDTGAGVFGVPHSVANPAMVLTIYLKM